MVEEGEFGSGGVKVEAGGGSETVLAATTTGCCELAPYCKGRRICRLEKLP